MQPLCVYPNYYLKKKYFFSLQSLRMSGQSINFDGNINLNIIYIKYFCLFFFFVGDFYEKKQQKIFNIDDIDVNKILVSKKEPYGTKNALKYFIGYNDNDVIRPLCLKLSQMTGYINEFDEDKNENKNKNKNTIAMSLKVNDKELFKNHNKIWKKIERLMSIDFDSKPVYGNDAK